MKRSFGFFLVLTLLLLSLTLPAAGFDYESVGNGRHRYYANTREIIEQCAFGESTIPATCTEPGSAFQQCKYCGYIDESSRTTIPAGHDWGEWTPNDDGTHTRVCKTDPSHKETLPCQFMMSTYPATCTADGENEYTCNNCGYMKWEILKATGHDWGEWTPDGTGGHRQICKNDASHVQGEAPCQYTAVITPATCLRDGERVSTCSVCRDVVHETLKATGHDWGEWVSNDDGTHTHSCKTDPAHKETIDCDFKKEAVPPTCTEGGYTDFACTVCGYGYWDFLTEPTGHDWGEWISNDDGTHTRTCKTDPAHKETFDCDFKEEAVPPTCAEGGYTDFTCTVCGNGYWDFLTEPTGHISGDWELIQKATDLREGEETRNCLACGTQLAFRSLPKLTHVEGRTATLEGEEFPNTIGRVFRIRYMYVPLDLSQDGTKEVRVIASNRYVVGTLAITIKEGKMMLTFKPVDDRETLAIRYITLFHDAAAFVQQNLDVLMDNPLPLDSWIPLPESSQPAFLFLRFRVGFDVPGMEIITLP